MEREIVCADCGRKQTYRKPENVRGYAPRKCSEHRKVWKTNKEHEPKSWEPVGEPR